MRKYSILMSDGATGKKPWMDCFISDTRLPFKNVITISEHILCGHQCRYEIFDRESDENNLDLEFFICQSAASKNYRSKISIYIDHWDYLI